MAELITYYMTSYDPYKWMDFHDTPRVIAAILIASIIADTLRRLYLPRYGVRSIVHFLWCLLVIYVTGFSIIGLGHVTGQLG
ncbi:hypothetical protein [Rhizobium leguminosarum]|uniref:hypothetical protein n=1 Tax=Rhizobium leguminosarum TaxID=384 RepID=UPI00102FB2E6|nr:hypothetical protein [Rhizobium leguminosarum]TBF70351.1 hypothetical protein ELG89_26350 [Rhizobium leguminosarum]